MVFYDTFRKLIVEARLCLIRISNLTHALFYTQFLLDMRPARQTNIDTRWGLIFCHMSKKYNFLFLIMLRLPDTTIDYGVVDYGQWILISTIQWILLIH